MPVIHLMRHGHVHNPQGVLYGRLPEFRLSEAGVDMAKATAQFLRDEGRDVARVVSSPLLRAQQTAKVVADAFGLAVETDERIIEAGNAFEGERVHPAWRFLTPRRLWKLRNPRLPSWGEPYVDQRDRMLEAIRDAVTKEPERETVLVSHQLPIWITRLSVEGQSFVHAPGSRQCSLASLTGLTIDKGVVVKVSYAQPASHISVLR